MDDEIEKETVFIKYNGRNVKNLMMESNALVPGRLKQKIQLIKIVTHTDRIL